MERTFHSLHALRTLARRLVQCRPSEGSNGALLGQIKELQVEVYMLQLLLVEKGVCTLAEFHTRLGKLSEDERQRFAEYVAVYEEGATHG